LNSNEFGNSIAIDDELKSPEDQPEPMTLEHAEPMQPLEMVLFYVLKTFILFYFVKFISMFNLSPCTTF